MLITLRGVVFLVNGMFIVEIECVINIIKLVFSGILGPTLARR